MSVENLDNQHYTEWELEVFHHRHEGLSCSPVGGPAPQYASIARLSAPLEFLVVAWVASKVGGVPLCPSHKTFVGKNLNRLFIGGSRSGIISTTFGAHCYSVSGVFVYCLPVEEGLDSTLPLGAGPWESGIPGFNVNDFQIPNTVFVKSGIMNTMINPLPLPFDSDVPLLNPIN